MVKREYTLLIFALAWLVVVPVAGWALEPPLPAATPQHPADPPPGASVPVPGTPRLARNAAGLVLALRDVDDPANPYRGQYTAYDRWYLDNYVAQVTPEEEKHFGG
jgi:hypothetical protein